MSIGVRASWLRFLGGSRARGFVSRSFVLGFLCVLLTCVGFLVWFHLDTGSNMAVFALCHSVELCREVGGTHLWVLAVASSLVAAS